MPNIELLEKSMPVAPIRIAALAGCRELAEEVDKKLVKFRKELVAAKKSTIIPQGYAEKSFLVDCECPRFGTGEGKGYIKESVRGTDLYIMVDVTNYSLTYSVCGHENHMSPDDHYQDLKRIISAYNISFPIPLFSKLRMMVQKLNCLTPNLHSTKQPS